MAIDLRTFAAYLQKAGQDVSDMLLRKYLNDEQIKQMQMQLAAQAQQLQQRLAAEAQQGELNRQTELQRTQMVEEGENKRAESARKIQEANLSIEEEYRKKANEGDPIAKEALGLYHTMVGQATLGQDIPPQAEERLKQIAPALYSLYGQTQFNIQLKEEAEAAREKATPVVNPIAEETRQLNTAVGAAEKRVASLERQVMAAKKALDAAQVNRTGSAGDQKKRIANAQDNYNQLVAALKAAEEQRDMLKDQLSIQQPASNLYNFYAKYGAIPSEERIEAEMRATQRKSAPEGSYYSADERVILNRIAETLAKAIPNWNELTELQKNELIKEKYWKYLEEKIAAGNPQYAEILKNARKREEDEAKKNK